MHDFSYARILLGSFFAYGSLSDSSIIDGDD
jgi:hypothetical protein